MAGNDWINSYLEAILDAGPALDDAKSSLLLRERGHFSPTRYFVEEVITGFDETDLHRSWVKVPIPISFFFLSFSLLLCLCYKS
jgi:sucrose-phosphate synthase